MSKMTAQRAVKIWCAHREKTLGELAVRIGYNIGHLSCVLRGLSPYSEDLRKSLKQATGVDLAADEASWREVVANLAKQEVA
jgi:hypothetical protein